MSAFRIAVLLLCSPVLFLNESRAAQQVTVQDLDKLLERADALLEEAKASYEAARSKESIAAFVDSGFKLEEARIKYMVLQELGAPEKQKQAGDRLRAVNQLSKLIRDGKAAVSQASADNPTAEPAPAPTPPPGREPGTPTRVDVTQRAPVPDAAKLREVEKQIRDLFKEQFSRKSPADRKALAFQLLEQAGKSQDDPAAQWVLLREGQDAAAQGGDLKTALGAIESAALVFDFDPLPAKKGAIATAGKAARFPPDFAAVTEASLALIEEYARADQYEPADRVSATTIQYARKSTDAGLLNLATLRAKEIAEARTLYQGMKNVLETLAHTPNDPAANSEMGKYLCFVKGSWDLGLRFLVKGSDAALKAVAEKEVTFPTQSADRIALADAWHDLLEKEKSPLRKSQLASHASAVYQSALPETTSLARARIEKRLEVLRAAGPPLGASPATAVDVTTLNPKRASVGYNNLEINSNNQNLPVTVKGKECKQYIFAHAPSTLVYDIPAGSRLFTAVGAKLDRSPGRSAGTWRYIVIVDGKTVFESKPLNEAKDLEVDISIPLPAGAREIHLNVDALADIAADWSIWAFPRFQR